MYDHTDKNFESLEDFHNGMCKVFNFYSYNKIISSISAEVILYYTDTDHNERNYQECNNLYRRGTDEETEFSEELGDQLFKETMSYLRMVLMTIYKTLFLTDHLDESEDVELRIEFVLENYKDGIESDTHFIHCTLNLDYDSIRSELEELRVEN